MSRANAIAVVHGLEVGWYAGNEARDPNPTLDGVTQGAYDRWRDRVLGPGHRRSVALMTPSERTAIYEDYFAAARCEMLPSPLDVLHFHYAFNAGPQAAIEVLQGVLGVDADGKVGPITRAAVVSRCGTKAGTAWLFCDLFVAQLAEYRRMIKSSRLAPNARSWIGRLITVYEAGRTELFAV